jgi:hypothetical protein
VSRKSTHPAGGSNRHPPDAVSHTTTGHFGQATGAISECYHSGAYIQTEALPRILVVLGSRRLRSRIFLPGVEEPYRCPADQAQNGMLERIPPRQDMIRVRAMREK